MNRTNFRKIEVAAGALFVALGLWKLIDFQSARQALGWLKEIPSAWGLAAGLLELAGGLCLMVPGIRNRLTLAPVIWSSVVLGVMMLGAAYLHMVRREALGVACYLALAGLAAYLAVEYSRHKGGRTHASARA